MTNPPRRVIWPSTADIPGLKEFPSGKWTGEGELSKWTPKVREFAAAHDLKSLEGIRGMCAEVYSFKKVLKTPAELAESYCKRTADEIISSRRLHVSRTGLIDRTPTSFPAVDGCLESSLAIAAALRAGGVPALFVREGLHSKVLFEFQGTRYTADESSPNAADPTGRRKGTLISGLDPRDVGMASLADYWISLGERGLRLKERFIREHMGGQ